MLLEGMLQILNSTLIIKLLLESASSEILKPCLTTISTFGISELISIILRLSIFGKRVSEFCANFLIVVVVVGGE